MTGFDVLVDGVDFGEGPRWHEGRLWYSDFFQQSVYAVTPGGTRERNASIGRERPPLCRFETSRQAAAGCRGTYRSRSTIYRARSRK